MAQPPSFGVEPRQTFETAMLSPCVGGLVQTWTETGSRVWEVADPDGLASLMGQGRLARTLREEHRFREVALLHEPSGTLLVQPRTATATADGSLRSEGRAIQLTPWDGSAPGAGPTFLDALALAVRHTVDTNGFLVIERGGWDAPAEPYCLFVVVRDDDGDTSVVEAAPAPVGARLWQRNIAPGAAGATMSAPATEDTLAVVPTLMIDACATWGLEPWDLAFTYGTRS